MTLPYQVLWIDDEHEKFSNFKEEAADYGIELVAFKSVERGIQYLRDNLKNINVVLLDAKAFVTEGQAEKTESLDALREACSQIDQLAVHKVLEKFVYSGQKGFVSTADFRQLYPNFYDKTDPDDAPRLFEDLKAAADRQKHTQLRQRYADAFAACTTAYAGERAEQLLYQILPALDQPALDHNLDLAFNSLRQLAEVICSAACARGFLPTECVTSRGVNLTNCAQLIICKRPIKVSETHTARLVDPLFPEIIAEAFEWLTSIVHNGSHIPLTEASPKLRSLRERVRTPYLRAAITYQLLDVLVCFKSLLDDPTFVTRFQRTYALTPITSVVTDASAATFVPGTVTQVLSNRAVFVADGTIDNVHIDHMKIAPNNLYEGLRIEAVLIPNDQRAGTKKVQRIRPLQSAIGANITSS